MTDARHPHARCAVRHGKQKGLPKADKPLFCALKRRRHQKLPLELNLEARAKAQPAGEKPCITILEFQLVEA